MIRKKYYNNNITIFDVLYIILCFIAGLLSGLLWFLLLNASNNISKGA